ncbi:hypothetical protein C3747_21g335 [Trypanosoma cruzi]|uniref:SET domain-containing protein n=2 Tax=Trypanosoma cruzi TaxID=5693 RepID=Q4DBM3_TRYCC|nr:hypothetical protein, conserved [Trypanosoma cruzi]EAN89920.1 hypothetical protein, conserved [Trypanosoma cruzi]PWV16836.1 hypothetical protein C3747_21g335 [Trypanosoma cruzi]RNC43800.1 putative SET and MYND domain-containing protein 3 [Trypanosoma cruzi]|eukprot:XP_811771.1 hypothetical protein [Trypanosoma cruzi strain CL Brener]
MPAAPQDRLVECVHSSDPNSDAGRYAVAKADISPGELVLIAAPYAVAMNPNEMPSAMSIATKVDEWVAATGSTNTASNSMTKRTRKNGSFPASIPNGYLPLLPHSTLCCNCLQLIPEGTLFLNYETIRWVSGCIAAEHANYEMERWLNEDTEISQAKAVDVDADMEVSGEIDAGDDRQLKKLQKTVKSGRMRSKLYVNLKKKLSEASARRHEKAMHEYHVKAMQMDNAQEVMWPERVVEGEHSLPEGVTNQGVCGCAGCGVIVYCSRACWTEHHNLHRASGTCQTLRRVYPVLMKTFMVRAGDNANSTDKKRFSPDSWSTKHWLRRTGEEAAWEMQTLLLNALLVAHCAREGFAGHMAEETEAMPATVNLSKSSEGEREVVCVVSSKNKTPLNLTNGRKLSGATTDAESQLSGAAALIATDCAVPQKVEILRMARLQCGGVVEVLDPKALEGGNEFRDPETASQLYFSLRSNMSLGVFEEKEETHAVRPPRWSDTARLVTNLSMLSKDSRSKFRCAYRRFTKLILPWLGEGGSTEANLTVTATFFNRLCAALQCNSFGLFNADGNCIGVALYPEASYFNHSCCPNICRVTYRGILAAFHALREIRKGEPLTICYVDVQETSTAERRRTLFSSYRFFCECARCSGANTAAMEIRLCDSCAIRGYILPVPPSSAFRWGMDAVQEGICSVCRKCVPWNQK